MKTKDFQELIKAVETLYTNVSLIPITNSGFIKYKNTIKSELDFLSSIPSTKIPIALKCSNYLFLYSIYKCLSEGVGVFQVIDGVRIDVVVDCQNWVKVKATAHDFDTLEEILDDESSSDEDTSDSDEVQELAVPDPLIIRQAKQLVSLAHTHPAHFKPPTVIFQFVNTDYVKLQSRLEEVGVVVQYGYDLITPFKYQYLTDILNLDVTTILAIVSSISHDIQEIPMEAFDSQPLKLQREMELKTPILKVFDEMFLGRTLVVCESVFEKSKSIVETVGGVREKNRFYSLFANGGLSSDILDRFIPINVSLPEPNQKIPWTITVIQPPPKVEMKLKGHNSDLISTGIHHKISTITSNQTLRSSSVEIHEPRGLIEQKWAKYSI